MMKSIKIQLILCLSLLFFHYAVDAQSSKVKEWYSTGKKHQTNNDFKAAAKAYIKAVEFCPENLDKSTEIGKDCINSYFNIGVCAQEMGKFKSAEEQFSIVIKHSNTDHEAYARRGLCRTQLKKRKKAFLDLEKAIEIVNPYWNNLQLGRRYWYIHNLALAYRNANKLEDAITYINQAIAIKDGAAIRIEKAKILLQLGRVQEVEKELIEIRRLGASNFEYDYIKGMTLMIKKDYDQAITYFDDVNNEKEVVDAYRQMTYCYIQLNYLDAARKYIQLLKDNHFNAAELAWLESKLATREGKWENALDLADYAESIHTEFDTLTPHIRLQRARVHYRQGNFQDAIGESNLVLIEAPLHIEASTLKGLSYLELGEKDRAGEILLAMANNYPNHPLTESRAGWYMYRSGQEKAAASKLQRLVTQYPDVAEIRYYYAEVCYQLEMYDPRECSASVDMAIGLDPTMEEAHALKARILHDEGHVAEADMFMNKAEDLGLIHSYAAMNAAKIHMDKGEYEQALEKTKIALRDAKELPFQRMYGLALGHSGNWKEAIKHFDYCIQNNGQDWKSLKARGYANMKIGQSRNAIRDYDRAIDINQNDAELYNQRGKTNSIFGEYAKASSDFKKAIQINPYLADAYYQKGRMYLNKRDYNNASFHLEQALSVAENDESFQEIGMLCNDLGLAKAELDDRYAALEYYDRGIELDPNDLLYENRARLHADFGDSHLAMEDYQKAIGISGTDPARYYELGKMQKISLLYWEASNSFTFAIEIKMKTIEKVPLDYYRKRGECYLEMGGEYLSSAEGDFIQLRDSSPRNWKPIYYLGKCKYQKGDFNRAIQYFTDALEIDNQQDEIYIARGDAYSMIELFGNAASDYGSAIVLNPEEICYQKKKGHANLRNENWIEAIKDYERAIGLAESQQLNIQVELYHGKGRAYSGKAYEENSDVAFQLAIDNYNEALSIQDITENEKYFIKLNMMTTYDKWGRDAEMQQIKNQLPGIERYNEPAVVGCS
ncbi:MAG: tetratricopeptide (TPR) repeat protein [Maribacter sp.]|jgi:tetratricopeptide (TPR) repeat protein